MSWTISWTNSRGWSLALLLLLLARNDGDCIFRWIVGLSLLYTLTDDSTPTSSNLILDHDYGRGFHTMEHLVIERDWRVFMPPSLCWDGSEKYTAPALFRISRITKCYLVWIEQMYMYQLFDVPHGSSPADPLDMDGHPDRSELLPRSASCVWCETCGGL